MEFPKRYEPKSFEDAIGKRDEEAGYYQPQESRTGKTFYIPIPPPNVTGNLHIGHALTLTLEDIMVRYHRMKGDSTLWVPGTDHAGIATQAKVEQKLAKSGKKKEDLGREKFLEEVWKWKDEYAANINNQARKMGASCDWSKERFTLDAGLNRNVEHVFVDLYRKGLLYRGEYMVNYSPALGSVISDIEVDYKEEDSKMYYVTYFVSGSDNELTIATTRPETLLADQAVAVHPKDKRFKKLIGRSVILPIVNKEIPIIADDMVDMEFGTGAVKITPAHDPTDFEAGKRHNLKLDYQVIDKNGVMTKEAGIFAGQEAATTARDNVVELLKAKGNLVKIEPYKQRVGYCSRGHCRIETVVSTQWFVKSSELAKKVIVGHKKGEFKIVPPRFNKTFEEWINNLRDWCVSRQLWWGHQIPAYYDVKTGELVAVSMNPEEVYAKFGKENVRRDDDVLDTWFSSALWPFSILDWSPENPGELFKKFYPASVLETGYDILFFWVIRMLLMGYEYTGKTPFETIYLHGLIFDETGRKMSKSWGNVIDPLDVIKDHSTDALRLSVVVGNTPGNNLNFSLRTVENNTLLLNKLWNVARFVWMNVGDVKDDYRTIHDRIVANADKLLPHEKWILSRCRYVTDKVTDGMEKFNFSETGGDLIGFMRDEFADFAIEEYKITKDSSVLGTDVMGYCLLTILKLLHPYIPFVTEELYNRITDGKILITSEWPECAFERDEALEKDMALLYDVIREIRNIRASKGIKPGENVPATIRAPKKSAAVMSSNEAILKGLAKISELTVTLDKVEAGDMAYGVVGDVDIFLDAGSFVDHEAEKIRLKAEIQNKKEYVRSLDLKLTNQEFIKNAPEKIIRLEQEKKRIAEEQLEKLVLKFSAYE
ncbi:MAG: valyl-tRNA synthetase [Patescibacteria group bacterium]|nr:valyl-tRNA synthetase [Patescibacteria group bacterium]